MRRGSNPARLRDYNEMLVFEMIRRYGPISRAEIAEKTALTPAAVTGIVARLESLGLIQFSSHAPARGVGKAGRKRALLEVAGDRGYVVGVQVVRTGYRAMVCDLAGERIAETSEFLVEKDAEATFRAIGEGVLHLLARAGAPRERLLGIGMGMPGPYRPGPSYERAGRLVSAITGLPVVVENNGTAAAVGEQWYGVGRQHPSFLYVYLGVGIGAGFIWHGEVYGGETGNALELGHVTVDTQGPVCTCGQRGCVEVYASPSAMVTEARRLGLAGSLEELAQSPRPEVVHFRMERASMLGAALVSAINLLDVDTVVLGGQAPELIRSIYLSGVEQAVRGRTVRSRQREVQILVSELGEEAGVLGAASLPPYQRYFPHVERLVQAGESQSHGM